MQKAVGLYHHVPFPSSRRHGGTPRMSGHPPCAQLLTLKLVAPLTSKLSSAFTIQQSVHVARSRKRVERRARPNAVICRAALMGSPARAQRHPPPLLCPRPRSLIHRGQSAAWAGGVLWIPMSHLGPVSWSSVLPRCSNTFSQGWATRLARGHGLQRYIDFAVATWP